MLNKKEMRKEIKEMWKDFQGEARAQAEKEIYEQLFSHPFWVESQIIATTISMPMEINTKPIVQRAWTEGKTVAVPLVNVKGKYMTFYQITGYEELVRGTMDILEPSPASQSVELDEKSLCIVPGLAFSKEGYRVGFGGGFYDRFLTNFSGKTVALAFHFQCNREFLVESYDIPVQVIVTNQQYA